MYINTPDPREVLTRPGVTDISVSRYTQYTYVFLPPLVAKGPKLRAVSRESFPNSIQKLQQRISTMRRPRISEVQNYIKSALKRVQRQLSRALTMMLCTRVM